ncbi:hypothetical protein BDV11DRAFT_54895 [Aspergillus similis]
MIVARTGVRYVEVCILYPATCTGISSKRRGRLARILAQGRQAFEIQYPMLPPGFDPELNGWLATLGMSQLWIYLSALGARAFGSMLGIRGQQARRLFSPVRQDHISFSHSSRVLTR